MEVNSTLFQFLLIELIPSIIESSKSQNLSDNQINLKLELLGFKLGNKFNEIILFKLNESFTKTDTKVNLLDIMKFICKDFWKFVFQKQINNLKTNNRGTFILIDVNFKLFDNLNSNSLQFDNYVNYYLNFTNGILRGILHNFGYNCNVNNDVNFPTVNFNIETQ